MKIKNCQLCNRLYFTKSYRGGLKEFRGSDSKGAFAGIILLNFCLLFRQRGYSNILHFMSCDKIAIVSAVISNIMYICTIKFQQNGMKVVGNVIQNWERLFQNSINY